MQSTKVLLIRIGASMALGLALLLTFVWWSLKVCTFHLVNESSHALTDVRFTTPPDEKSPQGFVRAIASLQPGERRWVFVVPPIYGAGEFSFTAAGHTHRTDVSNSTYAMGTVWTIRVDRGLRIRPEVKFSVP